MKKEDVSVIAQLLMSVKDLIDRLDVAERNKDIEGIVKTKKEITDFQKQIDRLI